LKNFTRKVQIPGFYPIVIVPSFDAYDNDHNVSLAGLLLEDINTTNIYDEFLKPYKFDNTSVPGVVAILLDKKRYYPDSLKLIYLEILHATILLAKHQIEKVLARNMQS